jgi:hypothetical protein
MEFVVKLRELLITYHNAFRLRLGQDPPANLRPLKIELKPDTKPKRIPARKYAPPQALFLAAKMADMERLGLVKKNLIRLIRRMASRTRVLRSFNQGTMPLVLRHALNFALSSASRFANFDLIHSVALPVLLRKRITPSDITINGVSGWFGSARHAYRARFTF